MPKRPALQTQFIIFVLLGDLVVPRGGRISTASLLRMLRLLGVSERAARSTLSRMTRKGWVKPERSGRHSTYSLTVKGQRLVAEGGGRIFEPRKRQWDGQWQLVVYSLPERKRTLRNALRARLSWLGFGRLAPGTWVSPHDRQAEVEAMLDDLGAREFVQIFSGMRLASGEHRDLVRRCWDLDGLNRQYARFVSRWEPEFEKCSQALVRGDGLSSERCFVQRFWIVHEYSAFPRLDPNLPVELLPDGWMGEKAAQVFEGFRGLLSERVNEFVEEALRAPNGLSGPRKRR